MALCGVGRIIRRKIRRTIRSREIKGNRPESLRQTVNAPSENVIKQRTIVTAFQPRPLTTQPCRKNGAAGTEEREGRGAG